MTIKPQQSHKQMNCRISLAFSGVWSMNNSSYIMAQTASNISFPFCIFNTDNNNISGYLQIILYKNAKLFVTKLG